MIDYLELLCSCVFDNGSWDLCLFHRYKDGSVTDEGPIPLSGLDEEPVDELSNTKTVETDLW